MLRLSIISEAHAEQSTQHPNPELEYEQINENFRFLIVMSC